MAANPDKLRVLQYNIFLRPPGFSNPSPGDFKDSRLDLFISLVLPNYDLVLLEEAFEGLNVACGLTGARLRRLLRKAKELGFHHHHRGPSASLCNGQFLDSGLLILSRHPIIERNVLRFQTNATSSVDRLASKGAAHVLLQIGSRTLDVVAAHTQASYTYEPSASIDAVQRGQISEIAAFVADCTSVRAPCPVLFGGDLNVDALLDSTTGTYSFLMDTFGSPRGSNECVDLLLEDKVGHEVTSVEYTWDKVSQEEVVAGSYLTRSSPPPAANEFRAAARFDYLLLLRPRGGGADTEVRNEGTVVAPLRVDELLEAAGRRIEVGSTPFATLSDHFAISSSLLLL